MSLNDLLKALWMLYGPQWCTRWKQWLIFYLFPIPVDILEWHEYDKGGRCLNQFDNRGLNSMLYQPRLLQQRMQKNGDDVVHLILIKYRMDPGNPLTRKEFWAYYERGMEVLCSFPPLPLWIYWHPGRLNFQQLKPPQAVEFDCECDFPISHQKRVRIQDPEKLSMLQMTRGPQFLPLLTTLTAANQQQPPRNPHRWPIQYVMRYLWKLKMDQNQKGRISKVCCIESLTATRTRQFPLLW